MMPFFTDFYQSINQSEHIYVVPYVGCRLYVKAAM